MKVYIYSVALNMKGFDIVVTTLNATIEHSDEDTVTTLNTTIEHSHEGLYLQCISIVT